MLKQQPDRLLRLVLGWTVLTLILVWLPLIRGPMDGASYVWGTSYWGMRVGGAGVGGQYWLLLIQGFVALAILALGWRGARPPLHALLLLWHGVFATSSFYSAISNPGQYRFRGDSMGIDLSLAWVGPLLFGGAFVAALLWVIMDRRRRDARLVPSWTRTNSAWLTALVLLLPVQFVLLRFGAQDGLTDRVGVVLTIAQCLLLGRIFRPARRQTGFVMNGR